MVQVFVLLIMIYVTVIDVRFTLWDFLLFFCKRLSTVRVLLFPIHIFLANE